MNPSELLKSYRGRRLKSQEEIAKVLNISRQTYVTWENNPISVETNHLFDILFAIGADESEIHDFFIAIEQDYLSYRKNKNN